MVNDINDSESWKDVSWIDDKIAYSGKMWTYGTEVWCNRKGRYLQIVADLSHLSGAYTMTICSLGVQGTVYERSTPIQDVLKVHYMSKVTFDV